MLCLWTSLWTSLQGGYAKRGQPTTQVELPPSFWVPVAITGGQEAGISGLAGGGPYQP